MRTQNRPKRKNARSSGEMRALCLGSLEGCGPKEERRTPATGGSANERQTRDAIVNQSADATKNVGHFVAGRKAAR